MERRNGGGWIWNQGGSFFVCFLICKLVQLHGLVCVLMGQSGESESRSGGARYWERCLGVSKWGPVHSGGMGQVPQRDTREDRGVGAEACRWGDLVPREEGVIF